MTADVWLTETYFDWLRQDCFTDHNERKVYEGVLRELHDIPFFWTMWSDENRAGDALAFRQSDFLGFQQDLDSLNQQWLAAWATATPSVLEVLLGMARRFSFFYEGVPAYYFGHMFRNMGYDRFPGRVLSHSGRAHIRAITDDWMSRQFKSDGHGSPFPVIHALDVVDMRTIDIWAQMNAYSAEHFQ